MGNWGRIYRWGRQRWSPRRLPQDVRAEFETLFRERADPWNYTSAYEQTKYERTLSLIPEGIGSALEIGCAEGHFTVQLAPRVRTLTACDIADTALHRAASRCREFSHVRFTRLDVARDRLPGPVDLVVCSEMLYYVGSLPLLQTVAQNLAAALTRHGYLVMAHMNLLVDDPHHSGFDWQLPFGGKVIGEVFQRLATLRLVTELQTPLYRIQLFQRVSRVQRWFIRKKSERIFFKEDPANLEPDVANHVRWMPSEEQKQIQ
jgi:2-polyprenyl-3-methyl-5-hydroxy-6-metoxy-1,4-benzoquinol methylase